MSFKQLPRKKIPLALMILGGLVLVIGLVLLGRPTPAMANSNDLANFEGQYPGAVGSAIDTCALCHTANIPALNPYGAAYKANGRSSAALVAIENTDSDGDGFSNLAEINAHTFPGDPSSHPAASASATPTSAPSSTPTTVVTLPTQQGPAPTSTMVPTETSTKGVTPTKPVGTPHFTKTPRVTRTPGPDKTPRVTRTPRPTGQPTPCVSEGDGSKSPDFVAVPVNGSGNPDDRGEHCRPSGGGGDDRGGGGGKGGGGGGEGGDASGGQSLAPSNSIVSFLDALFGHQ